MVETKAFQKAKVMSPQAVAEGGYEALMRGDNLYVAGGANKALVFKRRFLTVRGQARANRKMYETAKPKDQKRRPGQVRRKTARERHGREVAHTE